MSAVPPARRTRWMAHAAAWRRDSSSRAPAEIDGICSQSMASLRRSLTGDHRQRVAALDRVALGDLECGDRARLVRGDLVLHLHRLDDADQGALLDFGARLDQNLEDVALHRGGERVAAAAARAGAPAPALRSGGGRGRGAVGLAVDLDVEALARD